MARSSLRDFGYLLRNPTLERVGYSQISLREIRVTAIELMGFEHDDYSKSYSPRNSHRGD